MRMLITCNGYINREKQYTYNLIKAIEHLLGPSCILESHVFVFYSNNLFTLLTSYLAYDFCVIFTKNTFPFIFKGLKV